MPHVRNAKFSIVVLVVLATCMAALFTNVAPGHALAASTAVDRASYVDPFTGTGVQQNAPYGGGDTFPGADVPFGMVQWSPDTQNYAPGGYWYPDTHIRGFSLTHLNGAGCSVYSDIPFMPYVGTVTTSPASNPTTYISSFSHSNESAVAGYYQVKLDNGVNVELTATQHSGAGRFTYPAGQSATMLVNVSGSINGVNDAQANISGNTISGWATSGGFCNSSETYRVYFWAQFSQPFASYGTWHNDIVTPNNASASGNSQAAPAVRDAIKAQSKLYKTTQPAALTRKVAQSHPNVSVSGPGSGAFVTFNTSKSAAITVKVGLSFVSVANAQANVNQENPRNNFDQIRQQADQTWDRWLDEIQVSGGTQTQVTTFYTALYHVLLQPNVFSDVNGQYIGFDGQTHTVARGHAFYANFSGWDIYRSEIQMLALLAPRETSDIIQSMVYDYQQSGMLPKWALANGETYVMVGDPADPIIASAYAFGARDFDTKAALAAMVKEATQTSNVRPGLNYLDNPGYEPLDGSYGCCNFYGAASTTLEYNSADFAVGAFAEALNDTANAQKFMTRAQNWENLYNAADGYLEPRTLKGSFPGVYVPTSGTGWVEGDGSQYNWMVPFNLRGLFDAFGGNTKVVPRLDSFFSQLNGGPNSPNSFLGNEPTIETPWEYDYVGAPYKAQQVVRNVENTIWSPGPGGIAGNDDLGTMSAWYVWASLGMFPEIPGTADLVLASPLFPSITVHRESGQTIQITAPNASATTYYVQSLQVNGQNSTKAWLTPDFVAKGGTLSYTLGTTANTSWGANSADEPPSYQTGETGTYVSFKPGRAVVAPGASQQIAILGENTNGKGATVTWSATAPAGLSVSPTSGSFAVPANSTSSQNFQVAVTADTAEGYYYVTFSAQLSSGQKLPPITLLVVVEKPGSLLQYYNNVGISDDNHANAADYDGDGYSYSAQQLAGTGFTPGATVTVNGIAYTWPNLQPGVYDNIETNGQTIQTPNAPANAGHLSFLGSATNGDTNGTITITYTDGSTQTAQLGFGDWTLGAGGEPIAYNNVVAAKTAYRNPNNKVTTYVFASQSIALTSGKTVASITLPNPTNMGALHIFTYTIS